MDLKKLIGNTTSVPSVDFNQVVKCDNLRYWRISKATWVKDIVPIPITQKILSKNKWEVNAIDYDYSIKDKLYFRAFPTDRKAGCIELEVYNNIAPSDSYDVCQDDFYLGDISYVHDLQHLLFGLRLNHEMEV